MHDSSDENWGLNKLRKKPQTYFDLFLQFFKLSSAIRNAFDESLLFPLKDWSLERDREGRCTVMDQRQMREMRERKD